jgi:hypothetical protein
MDTDGATTTTNGKMQGEPSEVLVGEEAGSRRVGSVVAGVIVFYLIVLAVLDVYSLLVLWPSPTPAGGTAPSETAVRLFGWPLSVSDEVRLLLLVALTGALGGLLHALRSVAWYIGNQELRLSWLATYLTQPVVASTLSILFYLVIRGGFFSPQSTVQQTSPFGFAAMAGLIGLFSPQAVLKLKEIAETVLTRPPPGAAARPQETANEPPLRVDGRPSATGTPVGS